MSEALQYAARHRYARTTARKARLVADLIRGKSVNRALELLRFSPKRASTYYEKLVRSAVANASQDEEVRVNRLVISEAKADDGPLVQGRLRFRPGPQGRAMPIRKRTAHLTVQVSELDGDEDGAPKRKKRAQAKSGSDAKGAAGAASAEAEADAPNTKAKAAKKKSSKAAPTTKKPAKPKA
jgi:large subunit ribosomal protein L22